MSDLYWGSPALDFGSWGGGVVEEGMAVELWKFNLDETHII